ncbi:MAG: AgmX/PglI C-terminal domain-containing protein [Myxococcales bacterium]|nr:AgmX/PglI C-terminal domain-containing protein [Polyangiaceae bacterium]MDW8249233.1 AgmX/PglI C-terminal domain-containing protein [Myxococcales bacterium]
MEGQGKVKVSLSFAIYQGGALVRKETITQDIVKVGKDPKSHLRIDDELASRMHAVIEVANLDDITLIDLGNEPGTKVNGANINKCKIKAGDRIEIGGTTIMLESAVPATTVAPAAVSAPVAAASVNPFGGGSSNPFGNAPAINPFGGSNPFGANPFGTSAPVANPFGSPVEAAPVAGGPTTYTLIKQGPDVPADEVENAAVSSVEVMILWGTTVLHVQHLTPPRNFYVGEEETKEVRCDFFLPSEKLNATRAPVVIASGGTISAVLFPKAKGTIEMPGAGGKIPIQEAIATGKARPCPELAGAYMIDLPAGARSRVEVDGLVFQVASVAAGKKIPVPLLAGASLTGFLFFGLSFLVHTGMLAGMAFFKPSLSGVDDEEARREQQVLMQQFLKAAAEREQEEKPPEETAQTNADNKEGGTGTRAKGEEGSMGNPNTKATNNRFGVQGPKDNPDPHIARQAALKEAAEFGIIGLLNSGAGGDPNAPTAPWGRDDSLGNDPISARGNMWGADIGDSFGAGGLGLSGIGEGGGGRGEGIGLGSIGTIGHGSGTGTGQGFGSGHGRLGGEHKAKPPQVRMGATTVSGRLPPEVIQRIVRQSFGRFRLCYENGLRSNPNLQGRVSVRFVIDRSGAVSSVGNGGSDLPDSSVVSCVIRSFSGLSFPQPEGGIVTVVYPISFSPGG